MLNSVKKFLRNESFSFKEIGFVKRTEAEEIPVTLSVGLLTTIFITGKYNKKNLFLSLVYLLHVSNFLNCNKSKIFRRFKFFLRTAHW